jgi:hypothetical protein
MTRMIHRVAGVAALLTIATFWLSTVLSELFASEGTVRAVKAAIPWGLLLLVPALAAAGSSGFAVSNGKRGHVIDAKMRRMPIIAANGVFVLIPSALFLASRARSGDLDFTFYLVQAIELIAGATNLSLLGRNMRDGLKLSGRFRARKAAKQARPGSNVGS